MQKLMKKLHKNQKGFTLVELMVVVVIIGVLVAIAIPIYNLVTARAEEGACQANLRMIDGAIQQYYMNNSTAAANSVTMADLAGYFQEAPVCPSNNAAYTITNDRAVCQGSTVHTY